MQTFDQHLADLVRAGEVTYEVAVAAATRPSDFDLQMRMLDGGAPAGGAAAPTGAPAPGASPAGAAAPAGAGPRAPQGANGGNGSGGDSGLQVSTGFDFLG
jgi:twitching motility protein PilT